MGVQDRLYWTAEERLRIVVEARQSGQAISEVCRHHQIGPASFMPGRSKHGWAARLCDMSLSVVERVTDHDGVCEEGLRGMEDGYS